MRSEVDRFGLDKVIYDNMNQIPSKNCVFRGQYRKKSMNTANLHKPILQKSFPATTTIQGNKILCFRGFR